MTEEIENVLFFTRRDKKREREKSTLSYFHTWRIMVGEERQQFQFSHMKKNSGNGKATILIFSRG